MADSQLDAIVSRFACTDLVHTYARLIRSDQPEHIAALFTEDGVWCAPYRSATGPAEIEAWLKQSVPPSPKRMHYVMNSVINIDGINADAKSNYLVMVEGPDGPVPSVCGSYVDRLVRTPAGWKVSTRNIDPA